MGGDAPSIYLKRIEEKQGLSPEKLDAILRSHLIEPKYLRADDFDGFFKVRSSLLAKIVGEAMGKPVIENEGPNEAERAVEDDDELPEAEAA